MTVYHSLVQNLGKNSSNRIFLLITLSSSVFFSPFFQLLKENLQTLGIEIERLIKHQHELEQRTKKTQHKALPQWTDKSHTRSRCRCPGLLETSPCFVWQLVQSLFCFMCIKKYLFTTQMHCCVYCKNVSAEETCSCTVTACHWIWTTEFNLLVVIWSAEHYNKGFWKLLHISSL